MDKIVKPSFAVIGLEGSTADGPDFIPRLWEQANDRFAEVAPLAARHAQGDLMGVWGAMSDFSRSFQPWENGFTQGLYLAGVECPLDAQPPAGWTKWIIPGYEYLRAPASDEVFPATLRLMDERGLTLVGAVHDFTDPTTGRSYMMFPIRRL